MAQQTSPQKSNPFGGAKPRDENEIMKKKTVKFMKYREICFFCSRTTEVKMERKQRNMRNLR